MKRFELVANLEMTFGNLAAAAAAAASGGAVCSRLLKPRPHSSLGLTSSSSYITVVLGVVL